MKAHLPTLRRLARGFFKAFNTLLLPLALGGAAWFLARGDTRAYLRDLHLRADMLLLSFAIATAGLLLAVWIWRQILGDLGGGRHSFGAHVRIYCYSALGDLLPGGIWKIVSRSTLYESSGDNLVVAAAASITETLVVGTASMGLYALGTLLRPGISLLEQPQWGIAASLATLLLIHPWVLGRLVRRVQKQQRTPTVDVHYTLPRLLTWLGLEMAVVSIGGTALFTLLNSLTAAPVALLLPMITAWAAASAAGNLFFWMPGSPLLRDGAMILLLQPHLPLPVVLTFVALIRLWSIVSLLILAGGVWLIPRGKKPDTP